MLKKLRNKLLFVNMVSLAIVLILSFAVIFVMQYYNIRSYNIETLDSIHPDAFRNYWLSEQQAQEESVATDDPAEGGNPVAGDIPASGGNTAEVEMQTSDGAVAGTGTVAPTDAFIDEGSMDDPNNGAAADFRTVIRGRHLIDATGPNLALDYSSFFVVNVPEFSNPTVFSRMELSKDDYADAVTLVSTDFIDPTVPESGELYFKDSHWMYSYTYTDSYETMGKSQNFVFLNIDDSDDMLKKFLFSMFIIGGCVLGGLFLISLAFSNRALRPTEEGLRRQRQFVADASHELKTPLAIINANTEAALAELEGQKGRQKGTVHASSSGENATDGARRWMERISDESEHMRKLIDDLLFLARSEDAADIVSEKLPVDISALLENEIGRVETVLFERGITLEFVKPQDEVVVNADSALVRQVAIILLDNAMKYTGKGGKIMIETMRTKKGGLFRVSNTGEDISEKDLPHIFERFYRADKARTSGLGNEPKDIPGEKSGDMSGGYGLGLAIAKTIIGRFGGKITAVSKGGLTTFTVEFFSAPHN